MRALKNWCQFIKIPNMDELLWGTWRNILELIHRLILLLFLFFKHGLSSLLLSESLLSYTMFLFNLLLRIVLQISSMPLPSWSGASSSTRSGSRNKSGLRLASKLGIRTNGHNFKIWLIGRDANQGSQGCRAKKSTTFLKFRRYGDTVYLYSYVQVFCLQLSSSWFSPWMPEVLSMKITKYCTSSG